MTEIDPTYPARAANAAIAAIIDLFPDETGQSGVIEPEGAIEGLCLAIAMIAHNVGGTKTPAARRALADQCRKRLLITANNIDAAERNGTMPEWVQARPVTRSS